MSFDRREQITRPAVVEKIHALTQSPQRSRAKLIGTRCALGETIGKARPHMVDQEVGEQVDRLI